MNLLCTCSFRSLRAALLFTNESERNKNNSAKELAHLDQIAQQNEDQEGNATAVEALGSTSVELYYQLEASNRIDGSETNAHNEPSDAPNQIGFLSLSSNINRVKNDAQNHHPSLRKTRSLSLLPRPPNDCCYSDADANDYSKIHLSIVSCNETPNPTEAYSFDVPPVFPEQLSVPTVPSQTSQGKKKKKHLKEKAQAAKAKKLAR